MNNFIFKIKRSIVIPVNDFVNDGIIVYNTRNFGLGYSVIPNPREKVMTISLLVFRLVDEVVVRTLATFNVTEEGFKTDVVLNQDEINAITLRRNKLIETIAKTTSELNILYVQEAAMAGDGLDVTEISKQIQQKESAVRELNLQLNEEILPQPIYLYINKYSDIINYFEKDGSITTDGIEWAKTVPFKGGTLNDYIIT